MKQRYSTRILSCLAVLLISSTSVFAQDATTPAQAATDPNAAASCCCANMKNMDMGKTGAPSKCMTPAKTLMDHSSMKGMNHAGMDHSGMEGMQQTPNAAASCCCADMKNMDMGKAGASAKCMAPAKTLTDDSPMKGMNHAGMDHSGMEGMQQTPNAPSSIPASPTSEHGGH